MFAKEGQRLALDPPDAGGATIGGIVATGDTGPLRGRYGGPRDLVVGMRVALVRRHAREERRQGDQERGRLRHRQAVRRLVRNARRDRRGRRCACTRSPPDTATAVGRGARPRRARRAAPPPSAARALEHHGIDIALGSAGRGRVLARFAGAVPRPQAEAAEQLLRAEGLATEIVDDDEPLWDEQRAGQRGPLVVKVSAPADAASPELAPGGRGARRLGRGARGARAVVGALRGADAEARGATAARLRIAVVQDRPADLDVDPPGPPTPARAR